MPKVAVRPHGLDAAHVGADYTDAELEFLKAVDRLKGKLHRRLDSRDVLKVAHDLGYRRVLALECPACDVRVELTPGHEWPRACGRCGGALLEVRA